MLSSNGNAGSSIKYNEGSEGWDISAGGTKIIEVSKQSVAINKQITGEQTFTGDVNAAGGFISNFSFYRTGVKAGEAGPMYTSTINTGSVDARGLYVKLPVFRAGSLRGLAVYSPDCVVKGSGNGALTASLVVDGVRTATDVIIITGSSGYVSFNKDLYTLSAGSVIGVNFTASADYLNDLATSGSWVATAWFEV